MDQGGHNYGRKGSCVGKFLVFLLLFIILLVWVYYENMDKL